MTTRIATHAIVAWTIARQRTMTRLRDDRGEVTSQVILIAIFAALAIAVGAIVVTKVTDRANAIPTN
jgi:ABC-type Na+ efflux pump permease subunit